MPVSPRNRHTARRKAELESRSRHHKRCASTPEAMLWSALVNKKLGVSFRRQVVLGDRFIVDFFAPSLRLVIEVDGGWHWVRRVADARREEKLRRLGYEVLRVEVELVLRDLPGAVALVKNALEELRV